METFYADQAVYSVQASDQVLTWRDTHIIKNPYATKKESLIYLFNYYKRIISCNRNNFVLDFPQTDPEHLLNLCQEAIDKYDEFYKLDQDNSKVNRWLGFIQGVLICNGITSVEKERNFTRPHLTKHR